MCHIEPRPAASPTVLDCCGPANILTHAYSGAGNNIVQKAS